MTILRIVASAVKTVSVTIFICSCTSENLLECYVIIGFDISTMPGSPRLVKMMSG